MTEVDLDGPAPDAGPWSGPPGLAAAAGRGRRGARSRRARWVRRGVVAAGAVALVAGGVVAQTAARHAPPSSADRAASGSAQRLPAGAPDAQRLSALDARAREITRADPRLPPALAERDRCAQAAQASGAGLRPCTAAYWAVQQAVSEDAYARARAELAAGQEAGGQAGQEAPERSFAS